MSFSIFCHSEYILVGKKGFVCQCPPFCQYEFVLMAQKGSMMRLLTTFNLLKTTYNYRKVIPMTWLVVSFFLSCYLFANDPEMTPTYIEDKHEFNLQHISLLVIISVRQATFYSDFKDLPRSHNHESSINDTSHSD